MGIGGEGMKPSSLPEPMEIPMAQVDDLSRSLVTFDQQNTLVVIIEMSQTSWLVAGTVPGLDRRPLKKLEPNAPTLLRLVKRWVDEATKAGRTITRIVLAYEAGRDGFWLARWLRARGRSRRMSSLQQVSRSRASTAGPKRIASTPRCSCGCSWAGYAASAGTAAWWRSRPLRRRMPSVPAASARAWSARAPGSSTA